MTSAPSTCDASVRAKLDALPEAVRERLEQAVKVDAAVRGYPVPLLVDPVVPLHVPQSERRYAQPLASVVGCPHPIRTPSVGIVGCPRSETSKSENMNRL